MYFLDGSRFFIGAGPSTDSIEKQIENCIAQLNWQIGSERIFKLNFFVDVSSQSEYSAVHRFVNQCISSNSVDPVIVSVIAQAPFESKVLVEAFSFNAEIWTAESIQFNTTSALLFRKENTSFLIGTAQELLQSGCFAQSEQCFIQIEKVLSAVGFSMTDIIRQWNYIENILGFDGLAQNYQSFNDVRSRYYGHFFEGKGYPAATGIGIRFGGIMIDWIAMKSDQALTLPIDNPVQLAAHRYSNEVLVGKSEVKTTPKFERARLLKAFGKELVFISGTAAIRGEKTQASDSVVAQTRLTIENINELYPSTSDSSSNHFRVYVSRAGDFAEVVRICSESYANASLAFVLADICRDNLLVEIEGEIILHP